VHGAIARRDGARRVAEGFAAAGGAVAAADEIEALASAGSAAGSRFAAKQGG
jgi:hypothetical protein